MLAGVQRRTVFPLKVHSSGRYLIDQRGTPTPLLKDSFAALLCHLSQADITKYLQKIKDRGFNDVWVMLFVRDGSNTFDSVAEPNDLAGNAPFSTIDDIRTFSSTSAYAKNAQLLASKALALGITIELSPLYMGYQGGLQGWESVLAARTNTDCLNFGVEVAKTFKNFPNIIWMWMGDDTLSSTNLTKYQQIIAGIQSQYRTQLASSELAPSNSYVTDQTGLTYGQDPTTSDQQIGDVYASGAAANGRCYIEVNAKWGVLHSGVSIPLYANESPYYHNVWGSLNTREITRRCRLWGLTSGGFACGHHFGNDDRMNFPLPANILATLDDAATVDAAYLNAFFVSLPWWKMVPSGTATGYAGRTLIVSSNADDDAKVTACMTSDGLYLVAYVASTGTGTRTINVDLRSMAGSSRARWWNPTTGVYQDAAESAGAHNLSNSTASQALATPGDNGTGTNDWLLVLDV